MKMLFLGNIKVLNSVRYIHNSYQCSHIWVLNMGYIFGLRNI